MSFQTDFGDALRAARKRVGWSQTELAQRSGVHLNTVSQVERGSADPRLSTLQALGAVLGVNLQVSVSAMPSARVASLISAANAQENTLPAKDLPAFLQKQPE
jgi:transcriptional regulator with XRE-family HTH domain